MHESAVDGTSDWTTMPITAALLRGAIDLETTEHGVLPHRLPARARASHTDQQLALAESQPAGVRLALRTRATEIALDVVAHSMVIQGVPAREGGLFDLFVDGRFFSSLPAPEGEVTIVDMETGAVDVQPARVGTVAFTGLPDRVKDVEIWLPHHQSTELNTLRTNASVEPIPPSGRRVWLHHGSSISQGSNAASPSATWPALAACDAGVELINLGFSGSALLDPLTAGTMRDTAADLISVKIGINLVNQGALRRDEFPATVHGFLDTVRAGHPDTPLLVVSPILCPIHEHTPGPGAVDIDALRDGRLRFNATGDPDEPGALTLTAIRDDLARIVQQRDDPRLHYLDGLHLYGANDFAELPLPDRLHPDPAAHRRIAARFGRFAFDASGPFAV